MVQDNILKKTAIFEWYLLLLCIFSIPLFESLKTIFLLIASIIFLIRHYIKKDLKEVFFRKDIRLGFLLLALSASISAIFAQKPTLAIRGSSDFLRI